MGFSVHKFCQLIIFFRFAASFLAIYKAEPSGWCASTRMCACVYSSNVAVRARNTSTLVEVNFKELNRGWKKSDAPNQWIVLVCDLIM